MTRSLFLLPLLFAAACVESPPVMDPTVAPVGPTPDAQAQTQAPSPVDASAARDQAKSPEDRTINHYIRRAIFDDATIQSAKNVKIITIDGKVTLTGAVPTESDRAAVEAAATKVVGSAAVQDQIAVAPLARGGTRGPSPHRPSRLRGPAPRGPLRRYFFFGGAGAFGFFLSFGSGGGGGGVGRWSVPRAAARCARRRISFRKRSTSLPGA